jgi:hypothetical protein
MNEMAVKVVDPPTPNVAGFPASHIRCDVIMTQTVGHMIEQDSDGLLKLYF